jgi:hypothetical protein
MDKMSRLRKTDAMRLKEKRGQGYGDKYIPWIFTHEVPSNGRTHNILGWKHRRVYHLLSDGELWAFLRLQMQDNVFDIREQFPLLPLVKTLKIAEKFNIEHPPRYKKEIADKIIAISRTFMRSLEERMIRVQREELNVKEELLKDKPNLNTIQSIVNKKSQIISDIEFLQIKRDLEIKSLLTDQEYEKWKAILIKRVHRPMPFHGKMKDRPIEHRP